MKGIDPETGNSWFRESGVDRGEGGYRCRWTVKGGAAPDKSWEYRETHWEKADLSGYRELGAEKSGFNEKGETWWETWRELYNTSESSRVVARRIITRIIIATTTIIIHYRLRVVRWLNAPPISGRDTWTRIQIPRESGKRSGGNGLARKTRAIEAWKSPDEKIDTRGGKNGANTTIQTVFPCDGRINGPKTIKAFGGAISGKSA